MLHALLLAAVLLPSPAGATPGRETLPFVARETSSGVRLRVHLPPGADPGSIEVQIDERSVRIVAADADGRPLHSDPIVLRHAVVESDASADYDGEGWLTITLRRAPR